MFILHSPTYWLNQKPPAGSQINWLHPVSRGLVECLCCLEGAGSTVRSLIDPLVWGNFVGAASWKNGSPYLTSAGTDYIALNALRREAQVQLPFTVLFGLVVVSDLSVGMFHTSENTGTTDRYGIASYSTTATGNTGPNVTFCDGLGGAATNRRSLEPDIRIGKTLPLFHACSFVTNTTGRGAINGKRVTYTASGSGQSTIAYSSPGRLGSSKSFTPGMTGEFKMLCIFKGAKSQDELTSMSINPYQFIMPPEPQVTIIDLGRYSEIAPKSQISFDKGEVISPVLNPPI